MPRSLFLWTGSIPYEVFFFIMAICLYVFPVILRLISVVVGGGVSGRWWGGGSRSTFSVVFSGGSP